MISVCKFFILALIVIISNIKLFAVAEDFRLYSLLSRMGPQKEKSHIIKINEELIFSKNSSLKSASQSPVSINFIIPGIGEVVATIDRSNKLNDQQYSYTGKIHGNQKGEILLTVTNDTIFCFVNFVSGRKFYIIKNGSTYALSEKTNSHITFSCQTCITENKTKNRNIQKTSKPQEGENIDVNPIPLSETVIIDVLAIYTEKARILVGHTNGQESNNHDHIKNLYQTYIEFANTAMKNSDINVEFNVVHFNEIDFKELEQENSLSDAMDHMRDDKDGIMDELNELKLSYKPDLVSLVVSSQYGKSWDSINKEGSFLRGLGGTPFLREHLINTDCKYSVINIAAEKNVYNEFNAYVLAHELGHNFGCNHDRNNFDNSNSFFEYGHGHRFKAYGPTGLEVFCNTIMAYPNGPFDIRIGYFSNPDIKYLDVATGIKEGLKDSADNAQVIRKNAPLIANINGGVKAQNKSPVIVEVYPASGTKFLEGESFKPYVICYDPDGEVSKITIFKANVPKSNWIYLPNGQIKAERVVGISGSDPNLTYEFDIVVEDNSGAVDEKKITFTVEKKENKPPVIVETYPVSGTEFREGEPFKPYVICYDPDGTVSKITIFETDIPESSWIYLPNGRIKAERPLGIYGTDSDLTYEFDIVVEDNFGAVDEQKIEFTVKKKENKPPVIVETYPKKDSTVNTNADGHIIFYDPDGEIETLYYGDKIINKDSWVKLDSGYWKYTISWNELSPDTSYKVIWSLIDNEGSEVVETIYFKTKSDNLFETEPNGTQGQATKLKVGDIVEGNLAGKDDIDYFKLRLSKKQVVTATITSKSSRSEIEMICIDSNKNNTAGLISNRVGPLKVQFFSDQGYAYIMLKVDYLSFVENSIGYSLKLTTSDPVGVLYESESNNSNLIADTVPIGSAIEGNIFSDDDIDFFKIDLSRKRNLLFILLSQSRSDLEMFLYDKNMNKLVGIKKNSFDGPKRLSFQAGPGILYAKISSSFLSISENSIPYILQISGPDDTKPNIINHPRSKVFSEGKPVSLVVNASGGNLHYQWRKNGVILKNKTSRNLSYSFPSENNAGTYDVVVSNALGSVISNSANLTYQQLQLPKIAVQPVSKTFIGGDSPSFTVEATGSDLKYQWYKDGSPLNEQNDKVLRILFGFKSDAGRYYVVVSNDAGSITSNVVVLTHVELPEISVEPKSKTFSVGEKFELSVSATGGDLKYQWFKNGNLLIGKNSGSLSFLDGVEQIDEGEYYVVVSNSAGNVKSNTAILTYQAIGAPKITLQPQGRLVALNSKIELIVEVLGKNLSYQWFKDDSSIVGANSDKYVISNFSKADVGNYKVLITNLSGYAIMSKAAVLKLESPVRFTSIVLSNSGYIKIRGESLPGESVVIETSTDLARWNKLFSYPTPSGNFVLDFSTDSKVQEYFRVRLVE